MHFMVIYDSVNDRGTDKEDTPILIFCANGAIIDQIALQKKMIQHIKLYTVKEKFTQLNPLGMI